MASPGSVKRSFATVGAGTLLVCMQWNTKPSPRARSITAGQRRIDSSTNARRLASGERWVKAPKPASQNPKKPSSVWRARSLRRAAQRHSLSARTFRRRNPLFGAQAQIGIPETREGAAPARLPADLLGHPFRIGERSARDQAQSRRSFRLQCPADAAQRIGGLRHRTKRRAMGGLAPGCDSIHSHLSGPSRVAPTTARTHVARQRHTPGIVDLQSTSSSVTASPRAPAHRNLALGALAEPSAPGQGSLAGARHSCRLFGRFMRGQVRSAPSFRTAFCRRPGGEVSRKAGHASDCVGVDFGISFGLVYKTPQWSFDGQDV